MKNREGKKDTIFKCFENTFLFMHVFSLNWVINNVFKVTWQVHSTSRRNILVSQVLVLQFTHSAFTFRNVSFLAYRKVK